MQQSSRNNWSHPQNKTGTALTTDPQRFASNSQIPGSISKYLGCWNAPYSNGAKETLLGPRVLPDPSVTKPHLQQPEMAAELTQPELHGGGKKLVGTAKLRREWKKNQIWHGKHQNPKQFSRSHGCHSTDHLWDKLEVTHLHCFAFQNKLLLTPTNRAQNMWAGVHRHKSNMAAARMKKWEEPCTPKANKKSWGLKIVFGDFYVMQAFPGGDSPFEHWFYDLYKHYWLMSSPSFWFTRNIWFTKILICKELQRIKRSDINCHTGARLCSHLPSYHACDSLSKHPICLLLAVME